MVKWMKSDHDSYDIDFPVAALITAGVHKYSRERDSKWVAWVGELGPPLGYFKTKENAMRACEKAIRAELGEMAGHLKESIAEMKRARVIVTIGKQRTRKDLARSVEMMKNREDKDGTRGAETGEGQ